MHVGGADATIARLRDASLRERLRVELEDEGSDGFYDIPMDWSIVVVHGRSVAENAASKGMRPIDYVCDLLADEALSVSCIAHTGNEENVRATMLDEGHMVGSDGILVGDPPHPRGWGTFPRYFAVYVRELGILTWEQAVRKMTSLPAARLGFADRGLLRPGMRADVTCIDPLTVRDTATYERPRSLPEGIPYVLVNGRVAVDEGRRTDELAGRALRKVARRISPSSSTTPVADRDLNAVGRNIAGMRPTATSSFIATARSSRRWIAARGVVQVGVTGGHVSCQAPDVAL